MVQLPKKIVLIGLGLVMSPLLGGKGNREVRLYVDDKNEGYSFDLQRLASGTLNNMIGDAEIEVDLGVLQSPLVDRDVLKTLHELHRAVDLRDLSSSETETRRETRKKLTEMIDKQSSVTNQFKLLGALDVLQIGEGLEGQILLQILANPSINRESLSAINNGALDAGVYGLTLPLLARIKLLSLLESLPEGVDRGLLLELFDNKLSDEQLRSRASGVLNAEAYHLAARALTHKYNVFEVELTQNLIDARLLGGRINYIKTGHNFAAVLYHDGTVALFDQGGKRIELPVRGVTKITTSLHHVAVLYKADTYAARTNAALFTGEGNLLASWHSKIWDGGIRDVKFGPGYVAVLYENNKAKLFTLNGTKFASLGHGIFDGGIDSIATGPNYVGVVNAHNGTGALLDLEDDRPFAHFGGGDSGLWVTSITIDSNYIRVDYLDDPPEFFKLKGKKLTPLPKDIRSLVSGPTYVAVRYENGTGALLNLKGEQLASLAGDITSMVTDSEYVAVTYKDGSGALFDLKGNRIASLTGDIRSIVAGPEYMIAIYKDSGGHPATLFDQKGKKLTSLDGDILNITTGSGYIAIKYSNGNGALLNAKTIIAIGDALNTLSFRDLLLIRALTPAAGIVRISKASRAFQLFKALPRDIQNRIESAGLLEIIDA